MPSHSKLSRSGALPSATVRTTPVVPLQVVRPLTARELQFASDFELAAGNTRRGELLAWRAHEARTGMPA